ncbi:helix-turn-helix domain-containing protein [Lactobacillus sp. IBH004]|uniref:helix-turn-helix domain-containing protein n=1 Tax=Lactobacillus sp. IBH004 TaxID=2879107 RepID=UPI0022431E35|nr:HTH domain-containing protein [Lactobacillus sp. IBH004]UZN42399.1 helix-turn-helix domain-containing protein [Lactobacillus sp. IBH004]
MLNLTYREIELLNLFLNNDLLTISELKKKSGISARTLNTEFEQINKAFRNNGHDVKIVNQRAKGYLLDYSLAESDWLKLLKENCSEYLNLKFNYLFRNKLRIAKICRFLCASPNYIKIDQLASKLNFSTATINKDMRDVKKFLSIYNLKVKSVPYYGMKVVGKTGAVRSCLIDLFDVYSFEQKDALLPEYAFTEYGVTKTDLLNKSQTLLQLIHEYDFPLTDKGFRQVTKYLLVYKLRPDISLKINHNFKVELMHDKAFIIAEKLIKNSVKEELCLAIFLLINSEINQIPDLDKLKTCSQQVKLQVKQVCAILKEQMSLCINKGSDIASYIYRSFFIRYLKKKYDFVCFNLELATKKVAHKIFATSSLTVALYNSCADYNKKELNDSLFNDIVLGLYSKIHQKQNSYFPTNFLVVNDYGKLASEHLIGKLDLNKYNANYTFIYSYELENIDYSKYDYLLVSSKTKPGYKNINIPKITFSFFSDDGLRMALWQRILSTKRTIGSIANYFKRPVIIKIDALKGKIQDIVANHLIKQLGIPQAHKNNFVSYVAALITNEGYHAYPYNMYLTLLGPHEIKKRYFVFKFKQPVYINYHKVFNLQIIILDPSKGLLEIKNGDSELQLYFNIVSNDQIMR